MLIGICTHLGCLPKPRFEAGQPELGADWPGGFFCPCHGSRFDLAGRVFEGSPASVNLRVPPYAFANDTRSSSASMKPKGSGVMATAGNAPHAAARPKGFKGWLYKRLPVEEFIDDQLTGYYAPKNFNFWYYFGVLALVVLVLQLVHRHLPHHVLQGGRGDGVRFRRIHHARGAVRAG